MAKKAYRADNVEELLEVGAKTYVNHSRGVSILSDQLIVSRIYEWYQDDFGIGGKEVMPHLISYTEPKLAEQLKQFTKFEAAYDWNVNAP